MRRIVFASGRPSEIFVFERDLFWKPFLFQFFLLQKKREKEERYREIRREIVRERTNPCRASLFFRCVWRCAFIVYDLRVYVFDFEFLRYFLLKQGSAVSYATNGFRLTDKNDFRVSFSHSLARSLARSR